MFVLNFTLRTVHRFCVLADIYEKVSAELEKDGHLDCECVGGGRIKHDPQAKKIHVYGYSMVRKYSRILLLYTDVIYKNTYSNCAYNRKLCSSSV